MAWGLGWRWRVLKKIVLLPALKPHFDGAISENENLVSWRESGGRRGEETHRFLWYSRRKDKLGHVTASAVGTVNRLQDLDNPRFDARGFFCSSKCPLLLWTAGLTQQPSFGDASTDSNVTRA